MFPRQITNFHKNSRPARPQPPYPETRMSSLRRINSSRANGAKSRGPVTPGGKRISSGNALRHGLAAESVVLSTESRPRFEALLDSYMEKFQPRDQVEADLVEEMAVSKWRQRM
jgi:hypothetical protein